MATALTESQIITLVRKGIRQPRPTTVKDDDISTSIEVAIDILGQKLLESDPQHFTKEAALQSAGLTNIFEVPTDLFRLRWVKDLGQKAGMITGATNAEPIVITQLSHGFEDDDRITVTGVEGNTAANGNWIVQYVDASHYSLFNSEGNGDWSATGSGHLFDSEGSVIVDSLGAPVDADYGGLAFKASDDYPLIYRTPDVNASNTDDTFWYPLENQIIVDNPLFDNDIIIGYTYRPDAIAEIPSEFHQIGLVSYAVIDNLEIPSSKAENYSDLKASYERHNARWQTALQRASVWKLSTETRNVNTSQRVRRLLL